MERNQMIEKIREELHTDLGNIVKEADPRQLAAIVSSMMVNLSLETPQRERFQQLHNQIMEIDRQANSGQPIKMRDDLHIGQQLDIS
jgi:hypothetical protein